MKYFDAPLTDEDIQSIKTEFGEYVKVTVDLENEGIVVGPELHADAIQILKEKGGREDNIWGGGVDFIANKITTNAVLNIRTRLNNDNVEILDSTKREKFINIVKKYFANLWL